jgi:hypothetical protein
MNELLPDREAFIMEQLVCGQNYDVIVKRIVFGAQIRGRRAHT